MIAQIPIFKIPLSLVRGMGPMQFNVFMLSLGFSAAYLLLRALGYVE